MELLVIAIILVGLVLAIGGLVALSKSKRKKRQAEEERLKRNADAGMADHGAAETEAVSLTPDKMQVGWFFTHPEYESGRTVTIKGIMTCREDGYVWYEIFTENATGVRKWVSAERSDETNEWVYALWKELDESDYQANGEKEVTHDGLVFKRVEKGEAEYSVAGTSNLAASSGNVEYADFIAINDPSRFFSFERYNSGKREASAGILLDADYVRIERSATSFSS